MTYITTQFGHVSTVNSSTLALSASGSFVGSYESMKEFSSIAIVLLIGVPEIANIFGDFAVDALGTNKFTRSLIQEGTDPTITRTFPVTTAYFRLRVLANKGTAVNGAVQVIFNKTGSKPQTIPIRGALNATPTAIVSPIDASGRLQISNPFSLFDSSQLTTDAPFQWDTLSSGAGATTTYQIGYPQTYMNITAVADNKIVRQQHGYNVYQPGKSLNLLCSGTILTDMSVTDAIGRIGYYDDLNDKTVEPAAERTGDGFFFQVLGDATTPVVSVVSRSSQNTTPPATAVQVDIQVDREDWNIDPLDGTGVSGAFIDFSQRQVFVISVQWLGSSNVIMGIYYNFRTLWCHEFKFAGGQTGTFPTIAYSNRGSLPIRYELTTSPGVAPSGPAEMVQIASTLISEGGFDPLGDIFSVSNSGTKSVSTVPYPIVSLRLNSTSSAPIRPRVTLNVLKLSTICTSGGNIIFRIYKFHNPEQFGAGPLTGAVWINSNTDPGILNSAGEYDLTATALDLTGVTYPFTLVEQGYFANNNDSLLTNVTNRLRAQSDIEGNSDWIILTLHSLGANETVSASINWQEYE